MIVYEYHDENKVQHVLVEEKKTKLHVVIFDNHVRVRKLPKSELKFMKATDFNVNRAKRLFRARGRTFGITKGAKQLLRGN